MRNILFSLILLIAGAANLCANPSEQFAAANQSFLDGKFEGAYSGYTSLLDGGHVNSDLLYNLGNTSYRLERTGEAVLWYERALVIDPTHREARQNLRFLKRTTGILQFEASELDEWLGLFRRDTLVRSATFTGWCAILGIAAALTLRLSSTLKTWLWCATPILALVAVTAVGGIILKQRALENLTSRAIVTTPEASARTSPARVAEPVIQLPPGSQLELISERGKWDYVDIPSDLRGWVPSTSIAPLWPYDPALAD
ncbi:MAG: tetratricopeptide (TPR) repeat protein [Verrucomicrobiales bacterium]|jgi:tetratricopeptide (TPR) repeat protein